ncbi:MAG: hypothetical protein ABSG76_16405 [Xanthobacteraceae bacterium]
MLMASDRIAAELAAWQDRLAVVSRNLSEINEHPALLRIKARLRAAPDRYAGETSSGINDALAALDELWKDYLLINALLDQAGALRKQASLFHDHDAEIEDLLHGRSIALPAAHIPLAERGLLTRSERSDKVTADELLAAMDSIFTMAKQTVLAVDEAEIRLKPQIAALADEARRLAARADAIGEAGDAETARQIAALGDLLAADPLGAVRKVEQTRALLDDWRASLDAAERERATAGAALVAAREALGHLEQLSRQAQSAHQESSAKIGGRSRLPRPTDASVTAQFATWLDTLEARLAGGEWRDARAGLEKWMASCTAHQDTERRILAENLAPLAARDELRGRLKALHAKAGVYAGRGARLDPAAARLADEATDILYGPAADLDKAGRLISAYEAAINLAGKGGG